MTTSITVVIPVFNEEKNIEKSMLELMHVAGDSSNFEVIVVNDGSTDATSQILHDLSARYEFQVINLEKNRGYGFALKAGIQAASMDLVAFFDADNQHKTEDLVRLIANSNGCDLIVGYRDTVQIGPAWRAPLKLSLKFFLKLILKEDVPDATSGLRVWQTKKIRGILVFCSDGFSFSATSLLMAYLLNYKIQWEPISATSREFGSSTFNFLKTIKIIFKLLRISFFFEPLKFLVPVSSLIAIVGGISLINSYSVTGQASIKGLVLLGSAAILFINGFVIDFISKVNRIVITKIV